MRTPKKRGEVWYHIDRFSKRGCDVWAVQYIGRTGKPVYRCAAEVITLIPTRTKFFGKQARQQPKAVIVAHNAKVYWKDGQVAMIGSAA
jgi:hypothetical protein